MERFRRSARWFGELLPCIDAVREAAHTAEPNYRYAGEQSVAARRCAHGTILGRSGAAIPSAIHAARDGTLRRKHRPQLDRWWHAGAARGVSRCGPSRGERGD